MSFYVKNWRDKASELVWFISRMSGEDRERELRAWRKLVRRFQTPYYPQPNPIEVGPNRHERRKNKVIERRKQRV